MWNVMKSIISLVWITFARCEMRQFSMLSRNNGTTSTTVKWRRLQNKYFSIRIRRIGLIFRSKSLVDWHKFMRNDLQIRQKWKKSTPFIQQSECHKIEYNFGSGKRWRMKAFQTKAKWVFFSYIFGLDYTTLSPHNIMKPPHQQQQIII